MVCKRDSRLYSPRKLIYIFTASFHSLSPRQNPAGFIFFGKRQIASQSVTSTQTHTTPNHTTPHQLTAQLHTTTPQPQNTPPIHHHTVPTHNFHTKPTALHHIYTAPYNTIPDTITLHQSSSLT